MVAVLLLALKGLIAAVSTAEAQALQQPGDRIAIVNKGQGLLTVLNLQDRSHRVFKVGYLPHETVHAQGLVFVSNYGSAHVRSSDLTNEPGNTLSVIDLSRPDRPPKSWNWASIDARLMALQFLMMSSACTSPVRVDRRSW